MSYVHTQEVGLVRKSIRANLSLIILNLILLFVVSFAVVRTYALYENSLSVHSQWIATKTTLRRGVNGAIEFVLRPQVLARNQLNLGAWHGFQELLYRDELDLSQLEFSFRAEDGGYVHVLYDYGSDGFSGVRLSSNPNFPNLSYDATTEGEFTKIKELSLQPLTTNVWHQARLKFIDDSVVVTLDGLKVGAFKRLPGSQRIGFRGGRSNVWIDEVILTGRDGQVRTERFTNLQRHYQRLAFVFAGMLLLTIAWFIAALKLYQRVFATGNSVNDFFRNERHASCNLLACAGDKTRCAEIFIGFLRLGGKCFIVLARKNSDLAFVGLFEPDVHDACLSVADVFAITDGNNGDEQSGPSYP
jgi:hypothetical protein